MNDFRFNDTSKTITILKMDVEGEEMWTVPQILETNVLSNVKQIHIEVKYFEIFALYSYFILFYIMFGILIYIWGVNMFSFQVHVNEKQLIWTTENTHFNYHHYLSSFMKAIQKSVSVYGFRLIFYGPNELIERHLSQGSQYYSFFDIVLSKT